MHIMNELKYITRHKCENSSINVFVIKRMTGVIDGEMVFRSQIHES